MKKMSGILLTAFAAAMLFAAETKWEDFTNSKTWLVAGKPAAANAAGEPITFEGPAKIYTKSFRVYPAVNADATC